MNLEQSPSEADGFGGGLAERMESVLTGEIRDLDQAGLAEMDWGRFDELVAKLDGEAVVGRRCTHEYGHSAALQEATVERLRKDYTVPISFIDAGPRSSEKVMVCVGGILNTARRFDFLTAAFAEIGWRTLSIDWPGRGRSGWLAEQSDYNPETNAAVVASLLDALGLSNVILVGSSLGGEVGMLLAGRRPDLVAGLVLNDIGPEMNADRRRRRAEAVGRHYHFTTPASLFRRAGGAQKQDGPVGDAVLLHNIVHQTKWCDDHRARIYRHDPRSMQAYRALAAQPLDRWAEWRRLRCPVLLMHGMTSDALSEATIVRMQQEKPSLRIVDVPATGHTPVLADKLTQQVIARWSGRENLPPRLVLRQAAAPVRRLFA